METEERTEDHTRDKSPKDVWRVLLVPVKFESNRENSDTEKES